MYREANAWLGDEEVGYFDGDPTLEQKGMFMSYTPRIPPADVVNLTMFSERSWPETKDETFPTIETVDEEIVQRNKALVSFQIQQIKTAAAIAKQLGRTLVLPPILCGLDRVWFALRQVPGQHVRAAVHLPGGPRDQHGQRRHIEVSRVDLLLAPGAAERNSRIRRDCHGGGRRFIFRRRRFIYRQVRAVPGQFGLLRHRARYG